MKMLSLNNFNESGVYKILNTQNNRIYIGSTKCFIKRYKTHLRDLLKNKHINNFLQADFNKCGKESFEFHILEIVSGEQSLRLEKEQVYLNMYFDNGKLCYNLKSDSKAISRTCYSKNKEMTKLKLSKSLKEFYKNPDNRKRQSESLKGRKTTRVWSDEEKKKISSNKAGTKHSEQTKKKMSDSHKTEKNLTILKNMYEKNKKEIMKKQLDVVSKVYKLIDPTGKIVYIKNLNKFCRENKLHWAGFSKLFNGLINEYKGYKLIKETD